jgi:hypothetical protein
VSFDDIILEPEQVDLLRVVVEASRNVARENRRKFHVAQTTGGDFLMHPGLGPNERRTYIGDVEALAAAGFVSGFGPNFDVTPQGFRYYEYLHERDKEPVRTTEEIPISYLNASEFQARYPKALGHWRQAERLLWSAESAKQLTAIGHHCREAMQAFATALVDKAHPLGVDQDPAHVIARLRSVIEYRRAALGEATTAFLDALIVYWGTLSDLVQRQEHGAQKEGEQLLWADGRRVVFQTAVAMYEIDATLSLRQ